MRNSQEKKSLKEMRKQGRIKIRENTMRFQNAIRQFQ